MTIVEGQIESLKELKKVLNQSGITRFNSIAEINSFIASYDSERNRIPKFVEGALDDEIRNIQSNLIKHQKIYDDLKAHVSEEISRNIDNLEERLQQAREKSIRSLIHKILFYPRVRRLIKEKSKLENNLEKILNKKTRVAKSEVVKRKNDLNEYTKNKENIITERCMQCYEEIDYTKEVVDGLYALIAGAIGESSVVKELQKLSDSYILFNDYYIKFHPPIFNRKENDRIHSIQIDHVLICNSGIFLLETKNWSKQSIENLDLRSPVKQILRTSYALFVLLNSESEYNRIKLDRHHWGTKQIPVKNIIVMIHEKPKETFKHVKVVCLNELVGYITYFDPIFSDAEVKSISDYLRSKKHLDTLDKILFD